MLAVNQVTAIIVSLCFLLNIAIKMVLHVCIADISRMKPQLRYSQDLKEPAHWRPRSL
jgi:hypothetical protein